MKPIAPVALALLTLSCSSRHRDTPEAAPAPAPAAPAPAAPAAIAPSCARGAPGPGPVALDATGAGSSVALGRFAGRTIAFVADEDDGAIHTVDVDGGRALARTPLAGRPAQVLILRDGRVVASIRDRAALEVLEPGAAPEAPLTSRCLVDVAAEPVGLALTPDGETVLAASRWGHALTAWSSRDLARRGAVDLPRDASAVVAAADGRSAFVSHAVGGRVSVVALDGAGAPAGTRTLSLDGIEWRVRSSMMGFEKPMPMPKQALKRRRGADRVQRAGSQGFALARAANGSIFAPEVLVDAGPGRAAGGYGGAETGTVISQIAVIDAAGERATVAPISGMIGLMDCFLPRAAAVDPKDNLLIVACAGLDHVVAYDASKSAPREREVFRRRVGAGPTGIAIDAEARRVVVLSQFDGTVDVVPMEPPAPKIEEELPAATIRLQRARAVDPKIALGRSLFHAVGTRKIAFDGRACASCHPDGRDDGLTWSTQEGPRQTPMLLGRLEGTAPYGWEGDKKDLPSHFARTMSRLSGTGLSDQERDALFAYIASLAPPGDKERPELAAQRARGATLFSAEEVGCSSCHLGEDTTTDGIQHDIKSATQFEAVRAFETPSLRHIGKSAPYFHDGRYPTLAALVRGADGTMGHTKHLSDQEVEALSLYLESL